MSSCFVAIRSVPREAVDLGCGYKKTHCGGLFWPHFPMMYVYLKQNNPSPSSFFSPYRNGFYAAAVTGGRRRVAGDMTRTHVAVTVTGAASASYSQVTRKTEALSTATTADGVTGLGVMVSIPHSSENGASGAGKTACASKVGKDRPPLLATVRLRIRATRLSAI